jgi:hypothetical protein
VFGQLSRSTYFTCVFSLPQIPKQWKKCFESFPSDWRDPVSETIECECGSYADDICDIGFVNRISVMQLHAGRNKGLTVNSLPRMVAVVFVCLLLQNGWSTFAAFTTGNVKFIQTYTTTLCNNMRFKANVYVNLW